MLFFWREDPGDCIVCGAPHCTCGPGGPIVKSLLPERDARAAEEARAKAGAQLLAEKIQPTLGPNEFTTGTYRGNKRRRPR